MRELKRDQADGGRAMALTFALFADHPRPSRYVSSSSGAFVPQNWCHITYLVITPMRLHGPLALSRATKSIKNPKHPSSVVLSEIRFLFKK